MDTTRPIAVVFVFVCAAALVACGDNIKLNGDAGSDAPPDNTFCGNATLETGEDCDDGDTVLDSACDATCHFTCGNGAFDDSVGEKCDTSIATGPGSCPTACDDGDACTLDQLSNAGGCQAECLTTAITLPMDNDGCCPPGANAATDNDCIASCGNGALEPGELCDTGITGGAGACPTTCDDGVSCTADAITGTECQQACANTPITLPANNDGCCPPGANSTNDNDCPPDCGNGVLDPGETCDIAIPSGPGRCPTTCNDGIACTTNVLDNPGTCLAACSFPPITTPINNDNCCPTGANANNDNDCPPVCGNGIPEPGEACDDGNTNNTDSCANDCTIPIVAFRFSDLDLRDPHVFVNFLGCRDVTDTPLVGFSVNGELQTNIQTDDDADGQLDLSPVLVFRAYSQTAATQPIELHFADCTAPMSSTSCMASGGTVTTATATNMAGGQCLAALAGTLFPYTPAVTATTAPCFVTNAVTVTLDLGGIPITLQDAQVAATYVGNPATTFTNGLLRGFITEADANATIIPSSFPLVGGMPLSSLLPGGSGNCASHSDKDTNGGVMGWWFYLNFPASRVPWSD
jgi:cysteine-rich repeat protein